MTTARHTPCAEVFRARPAGIGADGDLDGGVEFLRGFGEGVRGAVANEFKDLWTRGLPRPDFDGAFGGEAGEAD